MLVAGKRVKVRDLKAKTNRLSRYSSHIRTHLGKTTPYWIRSCLQLPRCTFELRKQFDFIMDRILDFEAVVLVILQESS